MDAIGSFLKTALYRVIFVLIVGIPAVEVFSFALFENGVLIQAVDSENKTIPASVKLRFDLVALKDSTNTIPGNMTISNQGSRGNNTYPVEINIPNADIRLFKDDATLQVKDGNVIDLNGFSFKIRELPTSGWILYLTIAWVLGEILCFLGEFIIGLFFKWKFLSCSPRLEKVCPRNGAPYLRFRHFNVNEKVTEISEVHFVLSRVFAGLGILLFVLGIYNLLISLSFIKETTFSWCILFFIFLITIIILIFFIYLLIFLLLKRLSFVYSLLFLLLILLLGALLEKSFTFIVLITGLTSICMSVIYRTHANKLLFYSIRNGNNGSETQRDSG